MHRLFPTGIEFGKSYIKTLMEDLTNTFFKSGQVKTIGFKAHPEFIKADIAGRNRIVQRICEQILDL